MINECIGRSHLPLIFSFLFYFVSPTVFAQKLTLVVAVNGTTVEIKTVFDQTKTSPTDPNYVDPMDTQNGETSFGFFYRVDSDPGNSNDNITGNTGSYYWKDDIQKGTLSITKTINLPPGKYSLVAYQSRKSKPIRVLTQDKPVDPIIFEVPVPVGGSTSGVFESIVMGTGTVIPKIKLENSWNVFTDTNMATPAVDQNLFGTSTTLSPSQPWLFVTVSLQNWQRNVIMNYDENFVYSGAIFGNKKDVFSNTNWVSNISNTTSTGIGKPGQLVINPGNPASLPDNTSGQTHIHLVFQLKPGAVFFSESVQFSAMLEGERPVVLLLPVKPKPHDPNNLTVDKKTICPCSAALLLKYRVEFQNIGNGAVNQVGISLMNTEGLNMSTLKLLSGKTYKKGAPVTYSAFSKEVATTRTASVAYKFNITPISLPGTNQTYPQAYTDDETWDYIEFEVQANACLKDDTYIRPKARVTFGTVEGYLDTNIGETHVLYAAGQSTDAAPLPCAQIVSKNCLNCMKITPVDTKVKRN